MKIEFDQMETSVMENFKGGEKELSAQMHVDNLNKIMRGKLIPGASIGLHTHDTSSEIIFLLEGEVKLIYDGEEERLLPGMCHYCPKGHSHTMINESEQDACFFAVIPEQ